MLAFLNSAMVAASQRFISFELEYLEKGYWVDWQDLLLGTGITQNYEISLS